MTRYRIHKTRDRRFTRRPWRVTGTPNEGTFQSWAEAVKQLAGYVYQNEHRVALLEKQRQSDLEREQRERETRAAEWADYGKRRREGIEAGEGAAADNLLEWVHRMSAKSHQGSRIDEALPRIHFPTS